MRVIHTTADFDYLDNLYFSEGVMNTAMKAIEKKAVFVTDTNMAKSGINKAALARHGCSCECYMADPDIAETAKEKGTTRAAASVDKASQLDRPVIFAAGNAPTALVRLTELIRSGVFIPELVIGVPVGFVNVVQSKEMIIDTGVPCIVSRGRKGGSNVAAAICNALLYLADKKL
ncbi:MAG: precorrin-8X methylmutase, partial [Oscillospiraceae bacterium]|nr:precorrin-8X methylmutase [Oscillospiraceae bacterium]